MPLAAIDIISLMPMAAADYRHDAITSPFSLFIFADRVFAFLHCSFAFIIVFIRLSAD
jgi:hypothetical protein